MQEVLERQELLGGTGGRIAQLGHELLDPVRYARLWWPFRGQDAGRKRWMAEMGCVKPRVGEFDVHAVTSPCSLIADLGRVAVSRYLPAHVASLARSWSIKVSVSNTSSIATVVRAASSR